MTRNKNTYYIQGYKNYKTEYFHRLLYPEWKIIDHVNRNGFDNELESKK